MLTKLTHVLPKVLFQLCYIEPPGSQQQLHAAGKHRALCFPSCSCLAQYLLPCPWVACEAQLSRHTIYLMPPSNAACLSPASDQLQAVLRAVSDSSAQWCPSHGRAAQWCADITQPHSNLLWANTSFLCPVCSWGSDMGSFSFSCAQRKPLQTWWSLWEKPVLSKFLVTVLEEAGCTRRHLQ